ncbi:hypothetical protein DM860_007267 [Cuscuta australis]|uniref:Uncharacterized protein n=1 Tax=Cuscuta australis TaxID=267555 RepID=A0A328E4I2_9ASTE|nr:hypothetical protein DM860_007267 [Cuscuta australis]
MTPPDLSAKNRMPQGRPEFSKSGQESIFMFGSYDVMMMLFLPSNIFQLKRGSDSSIVLNNLYIHTALQSSFSCNMVG